MDADGAFRGADSGGEKRIATGDGVIPSQPKKSWPQGMRIFGDLVGIKLHRVGKWISFFKKKLVPHRYTNNYFT